MHAHNLRYVFSMLLAILFAGCAGLFSREEPEDFIRVRGTQFIHNGRPYYFGGANLWYGCYLGSPGATGDRERLTRELDTLAANGFMNLRVLAASEDSYLRTSLKPAITKTPGVLDDSLLIGLDYLLAEMAERRMRAVLYLNNYWEWSGGMAQYNTWANGGGGIDPYDTTQGWPAFMDYSASFYRNARANDTFREYVRSLILRRNTCNGRVYREDPTIMSWQLANEPRPGAGGPESEANLSSYFWWIDSTADFIHALDTNHLVSTGSEGSVAFRWSKEFAVESHAFRSIDYMTFHLWAGNWSWYDPKRSAETMPGAYENAAKYLADHLAAARELKKPLTLEEFGLARDDARCDAGTPTTARDWYFERILTSLLDSARAGAPIAGTNFWGWGGEGRARHPDFRWRIGDSFVADPPHEPQGYYSVFDTDASTLQILRNHAFGMMQLNTADPLLPAQPLP